MTRRTLDIVERGSGEPLVVIPGVQGRWEYSRGLVDALAQHYRVITFSLGDERASGPEPVDGMDVLASQVDEALDHIGVTAAPIVGVSFGGLVALHYAATRPARTRALVMFSAPGPRWHLRPRHAFYARLPWLFGPLFVAEAPFRLRQEVKAAFPDTRSRLRYVRQQIWTSLTAPASLSRMAARGLLIGRYDRVADCARVSCPTLIVHGDEQIDHVTGSGGTADYQQLIAGAALATVPRTGHIGTVTKPAECAGLVHDFLHSTTGNRRDSAA